MNKKKASKILLVLFLLAAVVLSIMFVPKAFRTIDNSLSVMSHTEKAPLMVAHRGLSGIAPQNSNPAV